MESSCMHLWSYLQDTLTLSPWKPCLPSSTIVLSCLIPPLPPPPNSQAKTFTGGKPVSGSLSSRIPSQGPSRSLNPRLTQTLVQVLGSRFGSTAGGGHGTSSQAGKLKIEILAGQRPSAWNSSLLCSSINAQRAATSKFSATIGVLSKDGGKGRAGTKPPTQSSSGYMNSLHLQNAHSSPAMCPAPTIQQTAHPGAFTLQKICCFPQHASPKPYSPSSQTLTVPKSLLDVMGPIRPPKHTLSMISTPAHETHATTSTTSFIVKERKSLKHQKRESLHTQLQIHIKNKQNTKLLQLTLII